uniref:Uncharacterized protein n=1 Tax=Panagrolaimus sp. JU765 TaxID=591449 RepID=A0AC34RH76_9BILA
MMERIAYIHNTRGERRVYIRPIVRGQDDDNDAKKDEVAVERPKPSSKQSTNNCHVKFGSPNFFSQIEDYPHVLEHLNAMYPTLDNVKILSFPRIPSKLPDILKYVKNNLKQLPRKRVREIDGPSKPRKRKADEDIDDLMSTSVLAGETKSLKLFLDAMAEKFKITDHVFTLEEWKEIKQVLSEIYNKLKWTALECLRSCGNVFSAFIAGFFMQNSFQAEFKK